ncbi:DUF2306 domain-containing protein [Spongiimicrobium sp. 2-473A-2-J]|uniref:DUF2306 domain-containing protein n=1 Tax=Eudoraea algarum TaxID=3417568 RepID=UPI003D364B53
MDSKKLKNRIGYFFMALFAIFIGLYPLRFIGLPYDQSLLAAKSAALLSSELYLAGFYTHIFMGGLALLTGFSQFFKKLRSTRLGLHRILGKVYVISVFLSGSAGLGIAFFATGGFIPALGFGALAVAWLYTTTNAFITIKQQQVHAHQRWMIRSYALCFAAVTLRLYLPSFIGFLGMDFVSAYKIIAWLCWVPNILVAEFLIIRKMQFA